MTDYYILKKERCPAHSNNCIECEGGYIYVRVDFEETLEELFKEWSTRNINSSQTPALKCAH